eukprot:4151578-Amphidinium_carterae.1
MAGHKRHNTGGHYGLHPSQARRWCLLCVLHACLGTGKGDATILPEQTPLVNSLRPTTATCPTGTCSSKVNSSMKHTSAVEEGTSKVLKKPITSDSAQLVNCDSYVAVVENCSV